MSDRVCGVSGSSDEGIWPEKRGGGRGTRCEVVSRGGGDRARAEEERGCGESVIGSDGCRSGGLG